MGSLRYCFLIFLASSAAGNDLATLRTALAGLQGRGGLSGSADFELSSRTKDSGDVQDENGRITFGWSWTNGQLALNFPQALLDRA